MATVAVGGSPFPRRSNLDGRIAPVLSAFLLVWLHILRNISPLAMVLQGGFVVGVAVLLLLRSDQRGLHAGWVVWVAAAYVYAVCVSFVVSRELGDPSIGIARMLAILPVIALSALSTQIVSAERVWRLFALFLSISALSIPYQWAFGPISWFAEASERAGFVRYASLVGSLTSFGAMVGIGLLISLVVFRGAPRLLLTTTILAGAVLSLQKAALANVVVAIMLGLGGRLVPKAVLLSLGLTMATAAALPMALGASQVDLYAVGSSIVKGALGLLPAEERSDVTIVTSVVHRWKDLPREAIEFHRTRSMFAGVGVFGGSGSLGYPDYPMAHNGIVELFLVFGSVIGGGLVLFLGRTAWRAIRLLRDEGQPSDQRLSAAIFLITALNATFASGGLFHPVSGFALWYSLAQVRNRLRLRRPKTDRGGELPSVRRGTKGAGATPFRAQGSERRGLLKGVMR